MATINGPNGRDSLTGTAGADIIYGGNGADSLWGEDGADRLFGENGDDFISGGNGNDRLLGGNGNDVLEGGAGNDYLDGGSGDDQMSGGTGNDVYVVDRAGDVLIELPGEGRDTVRSSIDWTLGDNFERLVLTGSRDLNGTGNDLGNLILGNAGANVLLGEGGNDDIRVRAGNDLIEGGAGRDTMWGGTGSDIFIFRDGAFAGLTMATCDSINDFRQAQGDMIDLQSVDANIFEEGDQPFQFIGIGEFNNVAGELRYDIIGGRTYIYGDTNGDGIADFMIRLMGSHSLTVGDFIL